MPEMQLDFDGREVTLAASMSHWHPTGAQNLLLRLARRPEGVRALEAGVALHTRRKSLGTGGCGFGAKNGRAISLTRTKGCCLYAASDGSQALKRLQKRGVVEQRKPRGPYYAIISS